MNRIVLLAIMLSIPFVNYAQNQQTEFEKFMMNDGKFNVVIGVILILFACISLYVFSIDLKVRRMEKQDRNQDLEKL